MFDAVRCRQSGHVRRSSCVLVHVLIMRAGAWWRSLSSCVLVHIVLIVLIVRACVLVRCVLVLIVRGAHRAWCIVRGARVCVVPVRGACVHETWCVMVGVYDA